MPKSMWPQSRQRYGPSSIPEGQLPADMMRTRMQSMAGPNGARPRNMNSRVRRPGRVGDVEIISSISELDNGPQSLPYDAMPVDLLPRVLEEYQRNSDGTISETGIPVSLTEELLNKIKGDTGIISSTMVISRGLIGRTITITTTPQMVIDAQFLRGYILLNPNELTGATAAGTLLASASRGTATGDLTGNSGTLGVANYLDGHFFVSITAISGGAAVTVTLQALDPASGSWFDIQTLVSGVLVTGNTYSYVGAVGTATDLRVSWSITAGDATFSVGYVLKNGLIGTSSGLSQTIYIGGPEVSVVSGFPLLNGQSERFFLKENVQLWAVANATLPMKIFEL